MTTYIGIDPGVRGAIAILEVEGKKVEAAVYDLMGQQEKIIDLLRYNVMLSTHLPWKDATAWVEETSGWNPKKKANIAAIRKLSVDIGFWYGVTMAVGLRPKLVAARTWQKGYKQCPGSTPKLRVRWYLEHTYPDLAAMCWGPRGGWNDNRADALGIALACWRAKP